MSSTECCGPAVELPRAPAVASGEVLLVPERVVTSPVGGVFAAAPPSEFTSEGELVMRGQIVGMVSRGHEVVEVRSPFSGFFMGMLADEGERVRPEQPLMWLRTVEP